MTTKPNSEERRALLQAVRVLDSIGQYNLASKVFNAAMPNFQSSEVVTR